MSKIGIRFVPRFVDAANHEIETWTLGMCDAADRAGSDKNTARADGDLPIVYSKLKASLDQEAKSTGRLPSDVRLEVASEMLDHLGKSLSNPPPPSPQTLL